MGINLLCSLIAVASPASIHDLPHEFWVDLRTTDRLHHGQMLEVVVCLKEGVSGKELNQYAANAPYVARVAPSKVEDDFRRSVVSCGYHRGMVFVIEGGGPKVD